MMTTNLFVIANVKQLRTGGSFRILLPFFRTSWGVGVLNSGIFNSFHNRVEPGMILEGLRNFGGGGVRTPHPPRYANIMNVCPPAWKNSVPTGRIFIKFDISGFFENLSRKLQFHYNMKTVIGTFTARPIQICDHISLSSS